MAQSQAFLPYKKEAWIMPHPQNDGVGVDRDKMETRFYEHRL